MESGVDIQEIGKLTKQKDPPKALQVSESSISTRSFKEFFGNSRVLDKEGKPKIVYHGSLQTFDEFDATKKADGTGALGSSYYFTDSVEDVNRNYARVGPDLKHRIELETTALEGKIMSSPETYIPAIMNTFNIDSKEAERRLKLTVSLASRDPYARWREALKRDLHNKITPSVGKEQEFVKTDLYSIATAIIEKDLRPTEGVVYPVYLRMEKPVVLQRKNGTFFTEAELEQFKKITNEVAKKYKIEGKTLIETLERISDGKGMDVWKIVQKLARSKSWTVVKNPTTGENMYGQLFADVLHGMGYDGAIINAEESFGVLRDENSIFRFADRLLGVGMKGVKGATHYVVWNSNQIRTAFSPI